MFSNTRKTEKENKTAREADKRRIEKEAAKNKKKNDKSEQRVRRTAPKTVTQTLPYENFVSEYVMLVRSDLRIGKQKANLYSKSFLIPDINYSSLPSSEQELKLLTYVDLLNGFDSSSSVQITLHNTQINKKEFKERILLKYMNDGLDEERREINGILHDKLMLGQNGIRCKKYLTLTVSAINFEAANVKFLNYETHLNLCMQQLGTEMIPLKANDRVRVIADVFRGVDYNLSFITREEFARRSEKQLCCPDYFEFKKDYFMFNEKYARCMFFLKLPTSSVKDTVFKELLETNITMIISKNMEFIDTEDAVALIRKQITNMKQEELVKTRAAAERSRGAFVDPIEGTELAENMSQAKELLDDLQGRSQKLTLCQFIIMLTADSHKELEKNTEALEIIARKHQIALSNAPYRQEQALSSVLPLGNSNSSDKLRNLQVRRTLTSESTAVFCPFNTMELIHENGLYYGICQATKGVIMFDRRKLSNPNGFIFGVPGSGKGVTAKIEIDLSILASTDEIIILDPEREYTALAKMYDGEIINISETSQTHINPLDLTENPDPEDVSYDPITAKLDFLLSFFSAILGNTEIQPTQKTIIDTVMRDIYRKHEKPTLKEYYAELELFEKENEGEIKRTANFLKQVLHLYVHGSMNVFSHESNVNINKRVVVYDIKDLGKSMQTLGKMPFVKVVVSNFT